MIRSIHEKEEFPNEFSNTSRWFLTHTYGGSNLPENGYLLPGGNQEITIHSLRNPGLKHNEFYVDEETCVYFTFGCVVPSTELKRFVESKCVFIIPFEQVFRQVISVSFPECIALGPVKIQTGAVLVLQEGTIIPEYYKENNISIVYFNNPEDRDNIVKQTIESLKGVTTSIHYSEDMEFKPFADIELKHSSENKSKVNPLDFFKLLHEKQPNLSIGTDSRSYFGYKDRLYGIHQYNLPSQENNLFNLFSIYYHAQIVLAWLNDFKDFSVESIDYFKERLCQTYASWTILNTKKTCDNDEFPKILLSLKGEIEKKYQEISFQNHKEIFENIMDNNKALNLNYDTIMVDMYYIFILNAFIIQNVSKAKIFIKDYIGFIAKYLPNIFEQNDFQEKLTNSLNSIYALVVLFENNSEWDNALVKIKDIMAQREEIKKMYQADFNILELPRATLFTLYVIGTLNGKPMVEPAEYFKRNIEFYFSGKPYSLVPYEPKLNLSQQATPTEIDIPKILEEIDKVSLNSFIGEKLKNDPLLNGTKIIDLICEHYPTIKLLFHCDAQVSQGYTIKTHTLMFFEMLKEHQFIKKYQEVISTLTQILPNIKSLFLISIALHDIGKPLGEKTYQHQYTQPILEKLLTVWGFSKKEIEFSSCLVNHDILGDLFKEIEEDATKKTQLLNQAIDRLKENCGKVEGLTIKDYFYLQAVFYLCDAGSYPSLYIAIMQESPFSCFSYIPKNEIFKKLAEECQWEFESKKPNNILYLKAQQKLEGASLNLKDDDLEKNDKIHLNSL